MQKYLTHPLSKTFIVLGGFTLFVLTAFFNLGIIALDDYFFVVSQIIPAQKNFAPDILANAALWHPILPYTLHKLSSLALTLGIDGPFYQLRFVLVVLAVINFTLYATLIPKFFTDTLSKNISLFFLCFYFISPLILTRPMNETACTPFLFISAYLAHVYSTRNSKGALWGACLVLALASLIRYQAGVCVLALFFLVGRKRLVKDWLHLGAALGAGFILAGLLDYSLTGNFYASIRGYLNYNLNFSGQNHGAQPFYVFILLFLALSLPPVFIARFSKAELKFGLGEVLAPLSYFLVFVVAHTFSPHKEERFVIPVLPLFFVCLTPLAAVLIRRETERWRTYLFVGLNTVLLFLTSFSTPQSNTLGLVRYLDEARHIQRIYSVMDTLVLFPDAYATRKIEMVEMKDPKPDERISLSCNEVVALRSGYLQDLHLDFSRLTHLASFTPGPLEKIIVKLNPKQNARRGTIEVYGKKGCE